MRPMYLYLKVIYLQLLAKSQISLPYCNISCASLLHVYLYDVSKLTVCFSRQIFLKAYPVKEIKKIQRNLDVVH